ncbi:hypothetical protein [Bradyrhizobium sp. DASA03007]|uniref:hypothetical protein n=1 Tax=unclassified Bradyrhizobium TaxID=2631580 RepID=UPI003F6F4834
MVDDRFKSGVVAEALARTRLSPEPAFLQPEFLRARALMSLRAGEEAMERRTAAEIDRELQSGEDALKGAIVVNPRDSYLWLLLYSAEISRNGFSAETTIRYLAEAYVTAPLEGWIAIRRNSMSLLAFHALDARTQKFALNEFAALVDSGFLSEAEHNLIGVGWSLRQRLVESLDDVDIAPKQSLSRMLSRDGVDLTIPHVQIKERPWK